MSTARPDRTRRAPTIGGRAAHGLALALGCGSALGCGTTDEGSNVTQAWNPNDTEDPTAAAESSGADPSASATTAGSATSAPMACDDVCESPPSDCQLAPGTCNDGFCNYPSALAGTPCTSGCTSTGFCDATGSCICAEGSCDATCVDGPNMTAACDDNGACVRTCVAPFDDCDGDPANGCEVPVGEPHQCDVNGLNLTGSGCWTAYCGAAEGTGVFNFGSYHCVDCSTCGDVGGGQCHWCNHDTGAWFPTDSCGCGSYLNAVCGPA